MKSRSPRRASSRASTWGCRSRQSKSGETHGEEMMDISWSLTQGRFDEEKLVIDTRWKLEEIFLVLSRDKNHSKAFYNNHSNSDMMIDMMIGS